MRANVLWLNKYCKYELKGLTDLANGQTMSTFLHNNGTQEDIGSKDNKRSLLTADL